MLTGALARCSSAYEFCQTITDKPKDTKGIAYATRPGHRHETS